MDSIESTGESVIDGDGLKDLPPPPANAPDSSPDFESAAIEADTDALGSSEQGDVSGESESGDPTRRRWPWITATVVLALLVVGLSVFTITQHQELITKETALSTMTGERDELQAKVDDREAKRLSDEAAAKKAASDAETAKRVAAEKQAAAEKAEADKAAAAEAAKNTMAGSGMYEIGTEKSPGTYRTSGPKGSSSCYYAVLRSPTSGSIGNIIDNNNISGQGIVTLSAGQYFETSRCNDWVKQ
jgi:hypothetical protein